MNTLKLAAVAAATLVVSLSALAEGATYEYPREFNSGLTRAEVRADLDAAQAMGMLVSGEQSYVAPATGRSLSRNEVRAELAAALANNELSSGETVFVAESHIRRHGTAVSQAASSSVAN
jgi:hypothetical protein